MKTTLAKKETVTRKWYVLDATDLIVGRIATRVATVLMGKHRPIYTPHVDTGDFIIITNAEKARFTGAKEDGKVYFRHTGYIGGLKSATVREMREKQPELLIMKAVRGMLPKNRLGRKMLKKLKVFAGDKHDHKAQQPEPLTL